MALYEQVNETNYRWDGCCLFSLGWWWRTGSFLSFLSFLPFFFYFIFLFLSQLSYFYQCFMERNPSPPLFFSFLSSIFFPSSLCCHLSNLCHRWRGLMCHHVMGVQVVVDIPLQFQISKSMI